MDRKLMRKLIVVIMLIYIYIYIYIIDETERNSN